jgi:putative peptidoglycan lipid II flippase
VPNLFRDLLAEGAMSSALVPTFARELEQKGKQAAWKLGNSLLNALLLVTVFIVVMGWMLARPVVAPQPGQGG